MKAKVLMLLLLFETCYGLIPMVINTWHFVNATQKAWSVLKSAEVKARDGAIDALTAGCKVCQDEQCDYTVGYGGSPDENGETTLDALIFDGDTIDMGAVGGIRRIKNAIGVARKVLENTEHSMLVGSLASSFAKQLGFFVEPLQTNYSKNLWTDWKNNNCQPNFWKDVRPDPKKSCGPYKPQQQGNVEPLLLTLPSKFSSSNHDTIGMIVIAGNGHIVAGTSTNGAKFKVPGRVGDSPIPGAGAYADSSVGAATATGDGDVMMRFLPSFLAVEQMRQGASPAKAANIALSRIAQKYPTFFGAVIAVDKKGNVGASCNGMEKFTYIMADDRYTEPVVKYVLNCTNYP